MTDFEERLKKAIQRGSQKNQREIDQALAEKNRTEELRRTHMELRLAISERIEMVVHKLVDQFPGFQFSSVFGESGWGAACTRDDLTISNGQRQNKYSRFEIVVRPINEFFVLDIQAKGTIANRERLNRNHFQPIDVVQLSQFNSMIDDWAVTFAELYSTFAK